MARTQYKRVSDRDQDHDGHQEHELQDMSRSSGGDAEEAEVLLSSFDNDSDSTGPDQQAAGVPDAGAAVNTHDARVLLAAGDAAGDAAAYGDTLVDAATLAPAASLEGVGSTSNTGAGSNAGNGPHRSGQRPQVPRTIIHQLINSPRVSKYVPFLVRNYYQPVYNGAPMGQGLNNDGVFTNMAAKPSANEEQGENLPSYDQAAMDATPPYWESSVISPGFEDEVFVDGLPVGSIMIFVWNFIVSFSFQFIGFFLTYLLHTSHGSKEGSRAGLGLTFMNYGYNFLPVNYYNKGDSPIDKFEPNDPNSIDIDNSQNLEGQFYKNTGSSAGMTEDATPTEETANTPVLAFALIALGLFIVLKSIIDYHRARQMEKAILNPNTGNTATDTTAAPEEV